MYDPCDLCPHCPVGPDDPPVPEPCQDCYWYPASKQRISETFSENVEIAQAGGKVAGDARKAVEAQTGVPVITPRNAAQLNQVVTDMIEGVAINETGNHETSIWLYFGR